MSPEEETLKALTGNGEPLLNVQRNIVNICINDNDNSLDAELFGTQEQKQEQLPPKLTTGTLTVFKELTCGPFPDYPPEFSPPPALCQELLALITPDQFLFSSGR